MKFIKNNLKLIIGFVIGVILASSITVYAYSYIANDIKYTKKDGTEISVSEALDYLYSRNKYIALDKVYLESGSLIGNVQITENNLNSTIGLSITGNSTKANFPKTDNRWEKEIDLTNFSILSFYGKKGANHGCINVYIDDENVLNLWYENINENWKGYFTDLSEYNGIHKLTICGGYNDSSGSTNSNTQYCDIRLYYK